MSEGLLLPVPLPDADSQGFWDSLATGELAICRCTECRMWLHPPLERCRYCAGETAFEPVAGRGTVFSYIVVRHPAVPGHLPPYVVALVDLEEPASIRLTGILDVDPTAVHIGMSVSADIRRIGSSEINGVFFVDARSA